MKRLVKFLKVLVYSVVMIFSVLNIALGMTMMAWYAVAFYAYKPQIDQVIKQSKITLGNDLNQLKRLTELSLGALSLMSQFLKRTSDVIRIGNLNYR